MTVTCHLDHLSPVTWVTRHQFIIFRLTKPGEMSTSRVARLDNTRHPGQAVKTRVRTGHVGLNRTRSVRFGSNLGQTVSGRIGSDRVEPGRTGPSRAGSLQPGQRRAPHHRRSAPVTGHWSAPHAPAGTSASSAARPSAAATARRHTASVRH